MVANVVVDIVLCLIVILGAVIGLRRGFIKMAAKPVKFFASIAIAILLCTSIADSFIMPMLETPISNYLSDFLRENYSEITAENMDAELPTLLKFSAYMLGMNMSDIAAEGGDVALIDAIIDKLIAPLIGIIANILSFVVIFIVANIVFTIIFAIINAMFSRGAFGVLNKGLGFLFSAAFALIISWGLAVVGSLVIHSAALQDVEAIKAFTGGPIYNFFNTYNPIELLLSF